MLVLRGRLIPIIARVLRWPHFFGELLRIRYFRGFRFLVQVDDGLPGSVSQAIVGIVAQKILERSARGIGIVEVVFINLADREQAVKAIFAAGIFPPQELVLLDGLIQDFVVVEAPAHLDQRFRDCNHAGVGFGGGGCSQIHGAISIDHALVIMTCSLRGRPSVQRLAHPLSGSKVLARPGVRVVRPRLCRKRSQ